jgi:hypothetical protein
MFMWMWHRDKKKICQTPCSYTLYQSIARTPFIVPYNQAFFRPQHTRQKKSLLFSAGLLKWYFILKLHVQ